MLDGGAYRVRAMYAADSGCSYRARAMNDTPTPRNTRNNDTPTGNK